jgi:hypothetical protein
VARLLVVARRQRLHDHTQPVALRSRASLSAAVGRGQERDGSRAAGEGQVPKEQRQHARADRAEAEHQEAMGHHRQRVAGRGQRLWKL